MKDSIAGQVLLAGYPAGGPPAALVDALAADALAGVILFKRNTAAGPEDVAAQVARLAEASARTPLVAIDQEGGRVQRLRAPVLELPPMRALGARDEPALTRRAANALGRQLAALGINVDLAPVLDVDTNPDNPVIGDRSFGADPHLVARHGLAFARGLADAGVLACGKHFPGHGDTVEDSHLALPALAHDMARLEAVELVPFRAARAELPAMMTAHIVFRALDAERPATLSRRVVTGLLREQLGFAGLVVSDDLEMKAIADHYSVPRAAVEAIRAGCDLLLICSRLDWVAEAREAIAREAAADAAFAARLREAAARVGAARARVRCAPVSPEVLARALDDEDARSVRAALA
ncbi:MAG: beta-N-acetylhexosaminidase [Sandaracinaceae bacterium]|nr:beta-N-acetylhexosaminidase [Sandaracinaceae bacterium]